ncbi:MAG TPA: tetratricopeptide repeat protein [Lacunisphaera sp.]
MSETSKAVFLSYASQDAEAAKRICDALRAAGVEVWFDAEGGLEHGDEWDAKIRRQIKECVLFIAVISANTQAREEGYFRIEWELAAQRALGIASGVAFILPVVIDDTREPDALVPDRFRAVQWTRLRGGELTPEVKARFLKLWSHRTGMVKHGREQGAGGREPERVTLAREPSGPGWKIYAGLAVACLALAGFFLLPRQGTKEAVLATPPQAAAASLPEGAAEARQLLGKAYGLLRGLEATREDFALAEEYCQRAMKLAPDDGEVWAAYSQLNAAFVYRGWDASPARKEQTRVMAERAIRLAPASVEARIAQAGAWSTFGINRDEREKLLREVVRDQPDNQGALRFLAVTLLTKPGGFEECLALNERSAALPGGDPLALFNNARYLWNRGQAAEGYAVLQRAIAQKSFNSALVLKMVMEITWRGDLVAAEATLRQLPQSALQEDRANYTAGLLRYYQRNAAAALEIWQSFPRDSYRDFVYEGPKGLLLGLAYELDHRDAAAKIEWRAALPVMDRIIAAAPNNPAPYLQQALLLACLGEKTAANEALRTHEQLAGLKYTDDQPMTNAVARVYARLGRFDEIFAHPLGGSRTILRVSPDFDALRTDPRFAAWLAESPGSAALPAKTDDKSVAVLAFANLSDDKNNEYFSDGISEELLNVLAKVPGLKVSARTSAFYFKGKDVPVPEVAKQLGVAYVVEGSVRKAGDKVRITAQLIKAADGFHVWSDTFTRDLKDVFAVQDEIAGLIAKNLELKLGRAVDVAVAAAFNPEAFRLYLQGREAWNRRDTAGFQQAELLFHRALELEPRFARAHAALADVWLLGAVEPMGGYAQRQSPLLMRAIAKAEQAVAMDEKSAEAHASLGHVLGYAWRSADARRALQRAIELNPNYASAHQWLGRVHLEQGELEEGIAMLRRAMELDPLSHRILDNYADALECAGRLEEAWVMLGRAATLQPSGVQIRCKQALLLRRLGRRDEALAAARALAADTAADDPDYRLSTAVAVLSACGETAEAEAALRRIAQDSEDYPVALLNIGRTREFIALLDNASINWIHNLWFYPEFAAVRAEAGLRAWAGKVGMAEALARAEAWTAAHQARNPEAKR